MKIFISNAVTGEDREIVTVRMQHVVNALKEAGHEPYCALFDPHRDELIVQGDKLAVFKYAFENIANSDAMVAIVASDSKSEGQLMEIGVLIDQSKPLYLFVNESASDAPTHLTEIATKTWTWSNDEGLINQLKSLA